MKTETTNASAPAGGAHTPGPWSSHGCSVYQDSTWKDGTQSGGRVIALAHEQADVDGMPSDEDLANARLIAAAPELLAACRATLAYLGCEAEELDREGKHNAAANTRELAAQLRAAIAKAEGRTP